MKTHWHLTEGGYWFVCVKSEKGYGVINLPPPAKNMGVKVIYGDCMFCNILGALASSPCCNVFLCELCWEEGPDCIYCCED